MMQPRRHSLIEAVTNAGIGCALGFPVAWGVASLGMSPIATGLATTGCMAVVSTARGYWIRRKFEYLKRGRLER